MSQFVQRCSIVTSVSFSDECIHLVGPTNEILLQKLHCNAARNQALQRRDFSEQKCQIRSEREWFVHLKYSQSLSHSWPKHPFSSGSVGIKRESKKDRSERERGWAASQWAQNTACSSSDEYRKSEEKKHGLHTSRLRNCDQTAIPPLFEGSCQIKSPAWIIRGDSCYKKRGRLLWKDRASRLRALHVWRYCSLWISEPSQLYFHIS